MCTAAMLRKPLFLQQHLHVLLISSAKMGLIQEWAKYGLWAIPGLLIDPIWFVGQEPQKGGLCPALLHSAAAGAGSGWATVH